jgi:outer membrane protein TolC
MPGTDLTVGLAFELPLFANTGARVRSARAIAEAERARFAVTEAALEGALVADYQRWRAAADRLTTLGRDVVPLQERATAQSEQAYREGARELVTALAAEHDLATVRAEVNAARIDAAAAWFELQLAAGGDAP